MNKQKKIEMAWLVKFNIGMAGNLISVDCDEESYEDYLIEAGVLIGKLIGAGRLDSLLAKLEDINDG